MINHFIKTLALAVAFCLAASAAPKMSKDLDKLDSKKNADVIVQFKQTPGAAQHQKVTNNGGTLKKQLNVVKGGVYGHQPERWIIRVIDDQHLLAGGHQHRHLRRQVEAWSWGGRVQGRRR